ncbi:hypothetical protein RDI58_015070 [Solanum bulbocastanum]
MARLA